jgi:hypothetical protein
MRGASAGPAIAEPVLVAHRASEAAIAAVPAESMLSRESNALRSGQGGADLGPSHRPRRKFGRWRRCHARQPSNRWASGGVVVIPNTTFRRPFRQANPDGGLESVQIPGQPRRPGSPCSLARGAPIGHGVCHAAECAPLSRMPTSERSSVTRPGAEAPPRERSGTGPLHLIAVHSCPCMAGGHTLDPVRPALPRGAASRLRHGERLAYNVASRTAARGPATVSSRTVDQTAGAFTLVVGGLGYWWPSSLTP